MCTHAGMIAGLRICVLTSSIAFHMDYLYTPRVTQGDPGPHEPIVVGLLTLLDHT